MEERNLETFDKQFCVVIALICAFAVVILFLSQWRSHQADVAYSRMKDRRTDLFLIAVAMDNYQLESGCLPYNPKGADYAFYDLRTYCENDATRFGDRWADEDKKPFWDKKKQRLHNSAVFYLNPAENDGLDQQITLVHSISPLVANRTGRVTYYDCAAPDERFLGKYLTSDGYVIADESILIEWEQVRTGDYMWKYHLRDRINNLERNDFKIAYKYDGKRLAKCTITTPDGLIEETVTTDDLGIITAVSRSPKNWKQLLPESFKWRE